MRDLIHILIFVNRESGNRSLAWIAKGGEVRNATRFLPDLSIMDGR